MICAEQATFLEYGIHVPSNLVLSERMVSCDFGEMSSSSDFALEAAKVKSVSLRHGICSMKSGASWLSFGILRGFHS